MSNWRWYLAETLLGWALRVAPMDEGGVDLNVTVIGFLNRQLGRLEGRLEGSTVTVEVFEATSSADASTGSVKRKSP